MTQGHVHSPVRPPTADETVTTAFYRAKQITLRLWFANFFKNGVLVAMMLDCMKLGG
jgi:hypothetical protein